MDPSCSWTGQFPGSQNHLEIQITRKTRWIRTQLFFFCFFCFYCQLGIVERLRYPRHTGYTALVHRWSLFCFLEIFAHQIYKLAHNQCGIYNSAVGSNYFPFLSCRLLPFTDTFETYVFGRGSSSVQRRAIHLKSCNNLSNDRRQS
jgi:hypothetical protein